MRRLSARARSRSNFERLDARFIHRVRSPASPRRHFRLIAISRQALEAGAAQRFGHSLGIGNIIKFDRIISAGRRSDDDVPRLIARCMNLCSTSTDRTSASSISRRCLARMPLLSITRSEVRLHETKCRRNAVVIKCGTPIANSSRLTLHSFRNEAHSKSRRNQDARKKNRADEVPPGRMHPHQRVLAFVRRLRLEKARAASRAKRASGEESDPHCGHLMLSGSRMRRRSGLRRAYRIVAFSARFPCTSLPC